MKDIKNMADSLFNPINLIYFTLSLVIFIATAVLLAFILNYIIEKIFD